jgi:COP9 signalosome complex subunit 2
MEDVFVRNYIEDLLRTVRTQVLLRMIKPYTRVRLSTIAGDLGVSESEVEALLVSLILDNKVDGHIDQVDNLLEMRDTATGTGAQKYAAISKCAKQLQSLHATVAARVGGI